MRSIGSREWIARGDFRMNTFTRYLSLQSPMSIR